MKATIVAVVTALSACSPGPTPVSSSLADPSNPRAAAGAVPAPGASAAPAPSAAPAHDHSQHGKH